MSTNNPLSGHTDGTNDGLTDGSHILSPSLTNLYEAAHGNGILLPHDTAYGDSNRNDPPDLPGAITAGSNAYSFVVKACDVILDGVLYAIGGGSDITVTLTTTTTEKIGTFTALTSGQECLFVVLATPDGLKVTQSDRITTAVGAYPSISGDAASYLKTGSGSGDNRQTVVLGTVRATFNSSAVSANDLDITISERNDKRVFVRPSPLYLSPVRDGTISATTGINGHTALSTVHTGQTGTFGDNGIVWQSFNSAGESMLYYSRKDGSNRHTHLLGPTNIDVSSPSANQTFTFDGDHVFVLTPSSAINLNPSGTFPPGHMVFVSVPSGSTVTFDSTGLNQSVAAGNALMFAYDGTNWKRVLFSSTVSTTADGASGRVQLSDGSGGFSSDSGLTFASSTLTVGGKAAVSGLVQDPTGVEFTAQASNPGTTAGDTIWLDSGDSNRLKQGSNAVMRAGDDISELNNDSNFVDAAGAAAAAPATNLSYTASTRVIASSTGTNATLTEVVAGGNSGLMTGAQATKLDGIAASATAYADSDAIAAVEGEATLDLTGAVTVAGDLAVDTNALFVDVSANQVGVNTATPAAELHVYGASNPEIRVQETGESGYTTLIGFADNYGALRVVNATSNESTIQDFEPVSTGTGAQTVRFFRSSNSGGTARFQILQPGTSTESTRIQADTKVLTHYGAATFNENGDSADFRVEGDTDTHLLFVDGSADKVGISTSSPVADFDVDSGKSFRSTRLLTVSLSADTTLTESGHAGRYAFVTGTSRTITLPATHAAGVHFTLLSNDANGFTLSSSDNMNGSSSDITVSGRDGVTCISDGTDWVVLGA